MADEAVQRVNKVAHFRLATSLKLALERKLFWIYVTGFSDERFDCSIGREEVSR